MRQTPLKQIWRACLLLVASAFALHAQEDVVVAHQASGEKLWKASIASMAAASVLDVSSSWGKRELNPLLPTTSTGTFNHNSALLKLGMMGGVVGVEYLVTRGHSHSKVYRKLAFINFGCAAVTGAVAARNFGIPSSHP